MPAYNFQQRFAHQVRTGEKRQTIRQRGKRKPPAVGEPLMLYTGMRTILCTKLLQATCLSVDPITISAAKRSVQMVRDMCGTPTYFPLDEDEIEALARDDGFETIDDFFRFFQEAHGGTLSGWLIKW